MTRSLKPAVVPLAAVAIAAAVPFMASPYRVSQLTLILVYAVAVLGLNLVVGFGGELSLGHGAFFALGAYVTAIFVTKVGTPHLVALVPAAAAGYLGGLALGLPAVRVRGLYLALLTLGLTVAVAPVIKRLGSLTGGAQGLIVSPPSNPTSLAPDQYGYLVVLAVALVMALILWRVLSGPAGRTVRALRDSELAARTAGVDRARTRVLVFAWSAMYAAVGGGLYVWATGFVAPESFTLDLSLALLAASVVGGSGSLGGAFLGAAFIVLLPEYAAQVQDELPGVVYGVALIACMYVMPRGAVGLLASAGALWRRHVVGRANRRTLVKQGQNP